MAGLLEEKTANPTLEEKGPNKEATASPEMQKIYDSYVTKGYKIIHGPDTRDQIVKQVSTGNPVDAIANTTVWIMSRLDASAEEAGLQVPDEIKQQAGNEIMGQLIDVAETVGVELNEEQREAAFRVATGKYLQGLEEQGKITPEELIQSAQQVDPRFNSGATRNEPGLLNERG